MGDNANLVHQNGPRFTSQTTSYTDSRPLSLRTTSEPDAVEKSLDSSGAEAHVRRKSTYTFHDGPRLSSHSSRRPKQGRSLPYIEIKDLNGGRSHLSPVSEQQTRQISRSKQVSPNASQLSTPPLTPVRGDNAAPSPSTRSNVNTTTFDFSQIDYQLDRARRIGSGLWSFVYLADPIIKSPSQSSPTFPKSPREKIETPISRLFAVKTPIRSDAKGIFSQEAKILTRLQQSEHAPQYIVLFHGLDARNTSLVFEGVVGGSLEDLTNRLKVMTELARHLELRALFSGLAKDLISALQFIHDADIVHADIKPANILLDVTEDPVLDQPVLRARYIDFSASFVVDEDSATNAGGTWDFMAPEQLRRGKGSMIPTYATDIWSLGITLLTIIVGGSPYAAACGDNVFMLREAVKSGDPLGFARMDPIVQKRMAACQDFVDCCRLALQKDGDSRYSAAAWKSWVEKQ